MSTSPYQEAHHRFADFHDQFKKTTMWIDMKNTRENSPWHRESNVAVHTQMLIDWYMNNLATNRSETQRMITLVSCLFHDVGKPPSEIIKHSEERGEYRAYHGHEQVSARMWVDYALSNLDMIKDKLRFNEFDIANIAMMLEHHVPFQLKDSKKRKALKYGIINRMGEAGHQAWLDLLMSDQHGRISDDQAEKLASVEQWMHGWTSV